MKTKMKKVLFYFLAALMGGCVPVMSLHPLYSQDKHEVVFDEELLGVWGSEDMNTTWHFSRQDEAEKTYRLVFSDKDGKKGVFVVHLLKLGDKLFLDVFPAEFPCEEDSSKWPYNSVFLVPAHTFIKVDSIEPKLQLRVTDDEKLRKLLKEEPQAIKHEVVEGTPVLTASTKELQQFLKKYADDDRLFDKPGVLTKQASDSAGEEKGKKDQADEENSEKEK